MSVRPPDAAPRMIPTFFRPSKYEDAVSLLILRLCQSARTGPFWRCGTGTGDQPRSI